MNVCLILIFLMLSLNGCAALQDAMIDLPAMDASAEILAVDTLAGDFLNEPYQTGAVLGIGYALALLRRWYKIKQGSKSV